MGHKKEDSNHGDDEELATPTNKGDTPSKRSHQRRLEAAERVIKGLERVRKLAEPLSDLIDEIPWPLFRSGP